MFKIYMVEVITYIRKLLNAPIILGQKGKRKGEEKEAKYVEIFVIYNGKKEVRVKCELFTVFFYHSSSS